MAHIDSYLQPCPGYGWQGGPEFNTQVVELQSGRESRNGMWATGRYRFTAPFNNISREAYRSILEQFELCRGQLHAFRFRNELDFEVENEVFGVGDGVQTEFQLSKTVASGSLSYTRNIYAPVDAILVTADFTPVSPVVDYQRGLVVFAVAPAPGVFLRWTGDFDIWVRFTQDFMPFNIVNINAVAGSVDLLEVPPPPAITT